MRWFILECCGLDQPFRPLTEDELEPRPDDARPADGDPFRPWYEEKDHLHMDPCSRVGGVESVHVFASSLDAAQVIAAGMLDAHYAAIEKAKDAAEDAMWDADAAFDRSNCNA